jgi:hypothetical protein
METYVRAEHDELWIPGGDPITLPAKTVQELNSLGFDWDEGTESWSCFT